MVRENVKTVTFVQSAKTAKHFLDFTKQLNASRVLCNERGENEPRWRKKRLVRQICEVYVALQ